MTIINLELHKKVQMHFAMITSTFNLLIESNISFSYLDDAA